jgi:hypothetical protein
MLAQILEQLLGLLLGGLAVCLLAVLRRGDQDVAGAALLVSTETLDVAVVVRLQLIGVIVWLAARASPDSTRYSTLACSGIV